MMMNITKKQYIRGFLYIVALLFVVRLIFPSLVEPAKLPANAPTTGEKMTPTVNDREEVVVSKEGLDAGFAKRKPTEFFNTSDSSLLRHKILSVASFKGAFPDENDTQLVDQIIGDVALQNAVVGAADGGVGNADEDVLGTGSRLRKISYRNLGKNLILSVRGFN